MKIIFNNSKFELEFNKLVFKTSPGEKFNEPVASQTGWHPLSTSNIKFRTKKLVTVDADRIKVKPTTGTLGLVTLLEFRGQFTYL